MEYKLTLEESKECQNCMWREKNLENIVMCPMFSCQKKKIDKILKEKKQRERTV
jgi:hypothetical protein